VQYVQCISAAGQRDQETSVLGEPCKSEAMRRQTTKRHAILGKMTGCMSVYKWTFVFSDSSAQFLEERQGASITAYNGGYMRFLSPHSRFDISVCICGYAWEQTP